MFNIVLLLANFIWPCGTVAYTVIYILAMHDLLDIYFTTSNSRIYLTELCPDHLAQFKFFFLWTAAANLLMQLLVSRFMLIINIIISYNCVCVILSLHYWITLHATLKNASHFYRTELASSIFGTYEQFYRTVCYHTIANLLLTNIIGLAALIAFDYYLT